MLSFFKNAYDQVRNRGILGFVSAPSFTPGASSTLALAPSVADRCQAGETETYADTTDEESETDVAIRFAAWEKEQHAQELRSAAELEAEACRQFTQATLVRHAVLCEEEGLNELARQLRRRAEALGSSTTPTTSSVSAPSDDGFPF